MNALMTMNGTHGATATATTRDLHRLKQTAGQVVGNVFFGTLLKMMRESPLKGKYGHGGRGEEVFAGQLDGVLAEKAGTALKRGLGDVLYTRLAHQQELISKTHEERSKSRLQERA
ncbi:MAG: hypothetical protein HY287_06115 [Planctomycetes bacterium]|nr:hypothetical protein [Planctomycetota bacterium]MBI3833888.1 hypothetical protein [Planctomycetota bacterium]